MQLLKTRAPAHLLLQWREIGFEDLQGAPRLSQFVALCQGKQTQYLFSSWMSTLALLWIDR